ncbi:MULTISPECIES: hypothetical protein [unclassified Achromobacter]|jgi:hypothetical protein|uniref:hypothetical protein n=1 Tax=unclassified Achromobacter TaxID=2626865 RepID=UPI0011789993|nr:MULTISPECIES: hypothetical protein [unclassified Achromobacter]
MFRTTPTLTPEQFRWLKELRTQASLIGFNIPQPVRGQLEAMNYIEQRAGKTAVTRPGVSALGAYVGPMSAR